MPHVANTWNWLLMYLFTYLYRLRGASTRLLAPMLCGYTFKAADTIFVTFLIFHFGCVQYNVLFRRGPLHYVGSSVLPFKCLCQYLHF